MAKEDSQVMLARNCLGEECGNMRTYQSTDISKILKPIC